MGKSKVLFLLVALSAILLIFAEEISDDYVEYLPETSFSCKGKVHGGFYADVETQCRMYHICSRNEDGILEDKKFLCGNTTVFDQRRLVCQDFRKVRCHDSPNYYRKLAVRLKDLDARTDSADDHQLLESPSYSMDFLPQTRFSCKGKVNGGYYADVEAQCQLYHVCSRNKYGTLQGTKFLCGNGTVFDQRKLVCQDFYKVRCDDSPRFYRNVATLLEDLEAKRRTVEDERRLAANANLELGRLF